MASGKAYGDEVKAQVMAELLTGQSIRQVAAKYQLPLSTVKYWSRSRPDVSASSEKAQRIGELLIQYLDENLRTLRAQAKHFRDTAWLKQQDASALAVLHGVMTDKAVRLLEALGANRGEG